MTDLKTVFLNERRRYSAEAGGGDAVQVPLAPCLEGDGRGATTSDRLPLATCSEGADDVGDGKLHAQVPLAVCSEGASDGDMAAQNSQRSRPAGGKPPGQAGPS